MKYTEIKVTTNALGTQLLGGVFEALGLTALAINEGREWASDYLEGTQKYWDFADINEIAGDSASSITAYLSEAEDAETVVRELNERIADFLKDNSEFDLGEIEVSAQIVDEEDWANNWKQYFKPTPIGEKLLICPSWERPPTDSKSRVLLRIDPGMAFGTGLHETTRMCLEALEKHVRTTDSVLDIGCGSGILSVAAALLGANDVTAIDVDPICEKIVKENALKNDVLVEYSTLNILTNNYADSPIYAGNNTKRNIVVSNIAAGVLKELSEAIPSLLHEEGVFISSGIISDAFDEVIDAYKVCGLVPIEISRMGEWVCVVVRLEKNDA